MYRDIVDWSTLKMSAHTFSMMFCRRYPQVTTSASAKSAHAAALLPYPWFFEQAGHAIFQLVKLLSIQS